MGTSDHPIYNILILRWICIFLEIRDVIENGRMSALVLMSWVGSTSVQRIQPKDLLHPKMAQKLLLDLCKKTKTNKTDLTCVPVSSSAPCKSLLVRPWCSFCYLAWRTVSLAESKQSSFNEFLSTFDLHLEIRLMNTQLALRRNQNCYHSAAI